MTRQKTVSCPCRWSLILRTAELSFSDFKLMVAHDEMRNMGTIPVEECAMLALHNSHNGISKRRSHIAPTPFKHVDIYYRS